VRVLRSLALLVVLALAASAGTYTVRWGDTLGGIAHRFGVPLAALLAANHLTDPDRVREGQILVLPGPPPPPAPAAGAAVVHRVAAGETLGAIARRYGTTVRQLVATNGIRDPNRVREGQVLRVGAAAPPWVCPVFGRVTFVGGFGVPRDGHPHEGVDIAAPRGTPIVANVPGRFVRSPNPLGGLAYHLEADDGDVYYGAHLDSYLGPDRHVRLGEPIGRVGDSGNARGGITHLHFERHPKGGAVVDPAPLLVRACPTA
jgi:LysM repeat protein